MLILNTEGSRHFAHWFITIGIIAVAEVITVQFDYHPLNPDLIIGTTV
jgi:hypothetical protein